MAQTTSSALSAAITFRVQKKVLENLRASLVYADRAYADEGSFDAGIDTLTFVGVPDIALNTTPLTDGTTPTAKALSITTVTGGWMDANKCVTNETLLRSELGRMDGFRFIEVVNAPTFTSTVTVYASIAVGNITGWGAGDLQTLRTYHVAPGGDHSDPLSQEELLGWKVNFGVAALSNSYYFRVESAAPAGSRIKVPGCW